MTLLMRCFLPIVALLCLPPAGRASAGVVVNPVIDLLDHAEIDSGSTPGILLTSTQQLAYGFSVDVPGLRLNTLRARFLVTSGSPDLNVAVWDDANGMPGQRIGSALLTGPSILPGTGTYEYRFPGQPLLSPNDPYWIVFGSNDAFPGGAAPIIDSSGTGPDGFIEFNGAYEGFQWSGLGSWNAEFTQRPVFALTAVPEPQLPLLLLFSVLLIARRNRR